MLYIPQFTWVSDAHQELTKVTAHTFTRSSVSLTEARLHVHWGEIDGRRVNETEEHFLWRRGKQGPHSLTHIPTDCSQGCARGQTTLHHH